MDWAPKVLRFILSGAQSHWWGLACPSHCFASGLPSLLAAYLLGLLSGLLLAVLLTLWGFGYLPAHPPWTLASEASGLVLPPERVKAYVNEQPLIALALRRRGA